MGALGKDAKFFQATVPNIVNVAEKKFDGLNSSFNLTMNIVPITNY